MAGDAADRIANAGASSRTASLMAHHQDGADSALDAEMGDLGDFDASTLRVSKRTEDAMEEADLAKESVDMFATEARGGRQLKRADVTKSNRGGTRPTKEQLAAGKTT